MSVFGFVKKKKKKKKLYKKLQLWHTKTQLWDKSHNYDIKVKIMRYKVLIITKSHNDDDIKYNNLNIKHNKTIIYVLINQSMIIFICSLIFVWWKWANINMKIHKIFCNHLLPHFFFNLYNLLFLWNTKEDIFKI